MIELIGAVMEAAIWIVIGAGLLAGLGLIYFAVKVDDRKGTGDRPDWRR